MPLRRLGHTLAAVLLLAPLAPAQVPAPEQHGIRLSAMDPSVRPGDNFYLYCNGAWAARTEIPADRTAITGFSQLAERTDTQLTAIISATTQSNAAPDTDPGRIASLYAAFMNADAIESAGLKPLQPAFARIDAIHDQRPSPR